MASYPDELRESFPGGEKARLHTEAYEQRIQKRGGEVLKQITTAHAVLNRAKTREFGFTIGEQSSTFADVGSGKNDSFSKGVCDKMFGKTYTALNWEERNFVDNLVYILAKEYGILMHLMREGDRFEFDFRPSGELLGKFKFYSKAKNAWLYSEWKPLMISEREEVVKHTREQLGASRLTAEALYQTGLRRTVLDVATRSGSLVATLEAFVKNVSLEDRKKILQGLDTFEKTVDPSIRVDQDTIEGINKYLRYHFQFEQGLKGAALEQKLKEHGVHPDGTAYRGTGPQNLAWVYFIRYDILHYPPPAGSKLEPILAPETLPVRFELKSGETWLPESIPEGAVQEANARLKKVGEKLQDLLGADAAFLQSVTAKVQEDSLRYENGQWRHVKVEAKLSFLGREQTQVESITFENRPGSGDHIPFSIEEVLSTFEAVVREEIAQLKEEEALSALRAFQEELQFYEKERVYFGIRYGFLQESIHSKQAQILKMESYSNAVFGTERTMNYPQAQEAQKEAARLKREMAEELRAFYQGDYIFTKKPAGVEQVDLPQHKVGLLARMEELTLFKGSIEQFLKDAPPAVRQDFERLQGQYEDMKSLMPLWRELTPSFATKEEFVRYSLNQAVQTLQAQVRYRNSAYTLEVVSWNMKAPLPTFELKLSLGAGEAPQEVHIRLTLPITYRVYSKETFMESFDFTERSNMAITLIGISRRRRCSSLKEAVFLGAKELEASLILQKSPQ